MDNYKYESFSSQYGYDHHRSFFFINICKASLDYCVGILARCLRAIRQPAYTNTRRVFEKLSIIAAILYYRHHVLQERRAGDI